MDIPPGIKRNSFWKHKESGRLYLIDLLVRHYHTKIYMVVIRSTVHHDSVLCLDADEFLKDWIWISD